MEQSNHSTPKENDRSEYEPTQMVTDNDKELEQQVPKDKKEKEESKPEDQRFNITKGMVSSDVAYQLKKSGKEIFLWGYKLVDFANEESGNVLLVHLLGSFLF